MEKEEKRQQRQRGMVVVAVAAAAAAAEDYYMTQRRQQIVLGTIRRIVEEANELAAAHQLLEDANNNNRRRRRCRRCCRRWSTPQSLGISCTRTGGGGLRQLRAPQRWQSQESVTATWIRFHNTSKSHTVRLFWYDYDGLLRPYKEIAPGGSCRQQTYLTHPWTFKVRPMRQTPPPPLTVQQQAGR
ncbi:hypothetical protein RI054_02g12310 [Pseudoscourfieldia marina]